VKNFFWGGGYPRWEGYPLPHLTPRVAREAFWIHHASPRNSRQIQYAIGSLVGALRFLADCVKGRTSVRPVLLITEANGGRKTRWNQLSQESGCTEKQLLKLEEIVFSTRSTGYSTGKRWHRLEVI